MGARVTLKGLEDPSSEMSVSLPVAELPPRLPQLLSWNLQGAGAHPSAFHSPSLAMSVTLEVHLTKGGSSHPPVSPVSERAEWHSRKTQACPTRGTPTWRAHSPHPQTGQVHPTALAATSSGCSSPQPHPVLHPGKAQKRECPEPSPLRSGEAVGAARALSEEATLLT